MMMSSQHYLVVDDDKTNNLICDFTIRKFNKNATVDLYLIPEKALLSIEHKYSNTAGTIPTILFLDVNMPSMSGFEFLDEFKKFNAHVRDQFTIYILSSSIEDYKEQAEQYPFVAGFLSKPLKISHLEEILNRGFERGSHRSLSTLSLFSIIFHGKLVFC